MVPTLMQTQPETSAQKRATGAKVGGGGLGKPPETCETDHMALGLEAMRVSWHRGSGTSRPFLGL